MSDYAISIDTGDYLYMQGISISESYGNSYTDLTVKMSLNSSNFNFDLACSDGKDFRLSVSSNGTGVLNMWIASWNQTDRSATVWFKIPSISAYNTLPLYAFWGNTTDSGISNINSVDFLLADDFEGSSVDASKWDSSDVYGVADSRLRLNTGGYIESLNTPISEKENWILECGAYLNETATTSSYYLMGYVFYGTENEFNFYLYPEGSIDRKHDAVDGTTLVTYNGTQKGIENDSYFNNVLRYYEPLDYFYHGMYSRSTYADYVDDWEREVYGDTMLTYFRIYGRENSSAVMIYIDWIALIEDYGEHVPTFDLSNLYVVYEHVPHQGLESINYNEDLTSTVFFHESSFGGNPYKLSDNSHNAGLVDSWFSSSNATSESEVKLTIDFGRYSSNLVDTKYTHFDDNHVNFLNASKLSDDSSDINENTYWQGTTTSGYAAIDFNTDKDKIGCLSVLAKDGNLSGMIKDFSFHGSNIDPRFTTDEDWSLLYSGVFEQSNEWQTIYFNNTAIYRYYILKIDTTYGSNISLSEWAMYKYDLSFSQYVLSQLRLYPVVVDSGESYLPKQILFKASNDYINWDTLFSITDTYTPFYDYGGTRWQKYSFTNTKKYWVYRVECVDNWGGSNGTMAIAEWSMHENSLEDHIERVFPEYVSCSSSNIQAVSGSAFDDINFVLSCADKIYRVRNELLLSEDDIGTEAVLDFIIL